MQAREQEKHKTAADADDVWHNLAEQKRQEGALGMQGGSSSSAPPYTPHDGTPRQLRRPGDADGDEDGDTASASSGGTKKYYPFYHPATPEHKAIGRDVLGRPLPPSSCAPPSCSARRTKATSCASAPPPFSNQARSLRSDHAHESGAGVRSSARSSSCSEARRRAWSDRAI